MRYHLFTFYQYYPSGGLGDYTGSFDTFAEADSVGQASAFDYYDILVQNEAGNLTVASPETNPEEDPAPLFEVVGMYLFDLDEESLARYDEGSTG